MKLTIYIITPTAIVSMRMDLGLAQIQAVWYWRQLFENLIMVRMMSPFFLHPKRLGYHLGRNYQSQTTADKKHFTLIMLYIKSWQIRTAAATGLIKLQFFLLLYLIVVFTMASGRKTTTQFPGVRTIKQSSRTRIELIPRNHQIGWFFWGSFE